jgi:hypothetical protein
LLAGCLASSASAGTRRLTWITQNFTSSAQSFILSQPILSTFAQGIAAAGLSTQFGNSFDGTGAQCAGLYGLIAMQ